MRFFNTEIAEDAEKEKLETTDEHRWTQIVYAGNNTSAYSAASALKNTSAAASGSDSRCHTALQKQKNAACNCKPQIYLDKTITA